MSKSVTQNIVAQSTAEAEYVALAEATKATLWMRNFLSEIRELDLEEPTPIHVDNNSAIDMAENEGSSDRVKHIDVRYHFIKDIILKNWIVLYEVESRYNHADLHTKALDNEAHLYHSGVIRGARRPAQGSWRPAGRKRRNTG